MPLGRQQARREVQQMLRTRDLDGITRLATRWPGAMDTIAARLYDTDELLGWRAIEALGIAARTRAGSGGAAGFEPLRERLRRLLWSMNHESGSTPWLAPDAAGEILANVPALAPEFARLVTQHIAQAPFERGVHRAISRIATTSPEAVDFLVPYLERAVTHPDPCIRAHAKIARGTISPAAMRAIIEGSRDDPGTFKWYDRDSGELVETTVGQAVSRTIGSRPILPPSP